MIVKLPSSIRELHVRPMLRVGDTEKMERWTRRSASGDSVWKWEVRSSVAQVYPMLPTNRVLKYLWIMPEREILQTCFAESISSTTKPLPATWFQEYGPSNLSQWADQNITPAGLPTMTHMQYRPSNTWNCSIEFILSNLSLLDFFEKSKSEGSYLLATPWQESVSI
jgi:hypothetical protein